MPNLDFKRKDIQPKFTSKELMETNKSKINLDGIDLLIMKSRKIQLIIYPVMIIIGYLLGDYIADSGEGVPDTDRDGVFIGAILYLTAGFIQGYVGGLLLRHVKSCVVLRDRDIVPISLALTLFTLYQFLSAVTLLYYYHEVYDNELVGLCLFVSQWAIIITMVIYKGRSTSSS